MQTSVELNWFEKSGAGNIWGTVKRSKFSGGPRNRDSTDVMDSLSTQYMNVSASGD